MHMQEGFKCLDNRVVKYTWFEAKLCLKNIHCFTFENTIVKVSHFDSVT